MMEEKEEFEVDKQTPEIQDNQTEEFADEQAEASGVNGNRTKIALIGLGGLLVLAIVGFGVWYLFLKGEGGKPVPAPRGSALSDAKSGRKAQEGDRTITLTDDQLKSANLKIVTVGESPGAEAAKATSTGVVKANEYRETPVISQVRGVVGSVNVELGDYVRQGQTVAVVSSEELAAAQSEYLGRRAELDEAQKRYKRALSLSEISEESRNELDATTANLAAAEARLSETKANLERSRKLAAIGAISKREFELAEAEYKTALAAREEADKRLRRANDLLKINPARKNEIDAQFTAVRRKQAEVGSMREKLLILGLTKTRVNGLTSSSQINSSLSIPSPVSGTVTKRMANRGAVVSSSETIASVTDLSTVWVIAQVYEKDIGKLRVGSGAGITSESYPGRYFRGNITYVDPQLDTSTRTAQVRIELANPDSMLKIGMYVGVSFATLGGMESTTPLVPEAAIQLLGDEQVVFEATDDPKVFIIRTVVLFDKKDGAFPVKTGIFVGDKIVTEGSFMLRAEWLKTNGE